MGEHAIGSFMNFFDHQSDEGRISILIDVKNGDPFGSLKKDRLRSLNQAKPVFAQLALLISDDRHAFIATLREHTHQGRTLAWLQDLSAAAQAVWAHRRALALRPYHAYHSDDAIRGWLSSLPSDAYVYDLRRPSKVRGWPYGVAGPSARLYRCGRLPVFAVAGSPTEGWRAERPQTTSPVHPVAAQSLQMEPPMMSTGRTWPIRSRPRQEFGGHSDTVELRPCA